MVLTQNQDNSSAQGFWVPTMPKLKNTHSLLSTTQHLDCYPHYHLAQWPPNLYLHVSPLVETLLCTDLHLFINYIYMCYSSDKLYYVTHTKIEIKKDHSCPKCIWGNIMWPPMKERLCNISGISSSKMSSSLQTKIWKFFHLE